MELYGKKQSPFFKEEEYAQSLYKSCKVFARALFFTLGFTADRDGYGWGNNSGDDDDDDASYGTGVIIEIILWDVNNNIVCCCFLFCFDVIVSFCSFL